MATPPVQPRLKLQREPDLHTGITSVIISGANSNNSSKLSIASLNIRTLTCHGLPELIAESLHTSNIDICGLMETRLDAPAPRWVMTQSSQRYRLYCGPAVNGQQGVGFLIHSRLVNLISSWTAVDTRIVKLVLNTSPLPYTIIFVYAPHNGHSDETKDGFYDVLDQTISSAQHQSVVMVVGDFNAQVASNLNLPHVKGKWSPKQTTTDNGFRMIDFAEKHKLFISSTAFKHKAAHLYTWISPNHTRTQIDHFLISRRFMSSVRDVRSYWGLNFGSDHALVKATFNLKLKINSNKISKRINTKFLEIPSHLTQFQSALRREVSTTSSWCELSI